MPRRRITFKTFSPATRSIARAIRRSALLLACITLCAPSPPPVPSLSTILSNHLAALRALNLREPSTHETEGILSGNTFAGSFHEWQEGDSERRDEQFGIRSERMLRVGDHLWVQNASGEVRELHGLLARRRLTEDFIDNGVFAEHPEAVTYVDREVLPDGRAVYVLRVAPPDGEPYEVGIDAKNWLVDEKSYVDQDSVATAIFSDYRVVHGFLIPFTEIDSDGQHDFDVISRVTSVLVDEPIADTVFAPFSPAIVQTSAPVTVPVIERGGLIFAKVMIEGKDYTFLVDSAAQGLVFDTKLTAALGLHPSGTVEIRGAGRTTSPGVVEAPPVSVGGVNFPMRFATVIDLPDFPGQHADGILGYSFFAAAEVRFDPTQQTMTIAAPGALPLDGVKLDVDTDRELPEIVAKIEGAPTRVIVDTGDVRELLVFKNFVDAHPGLVRVAMFGPTLNRGVGGSVDAVGTIVGELQIGPYRLFNRYANVVL
ncbi:MAG TPA: aspartyl protease family protein, partial [Candidatus Acidoferrales bacterium]|nr:aspartyl protease family protein [Candidatus Acidoferrales bacterium]